MKSILIAVNIFVLCSFSHPDLGIVFMDTSDSNLFSITGEGTDTVQFIRLINNSSLKRLPGVIRDLSIALQESTFPINRTLNRKGLAIHLYDVKLGNDKISAAIQYRPGDEMYSMQLNGINKWAGDNALAVTLVHEIVHCVLLNIDKNARMGNCEALAMVKIFDSTLCGATTVPDNGYFSLMNKGESGQHELMYRLFYPKMVLLLKRFTEIHNEAVHDRKHLDYLVWSGLQKTDEYEKLNDDEKREIETAILIEKGLWDQ